VHTKIKNITVNIKSSIKKISF